MHDTQLRTDFIHAMSRAAATVSVVTTDGPAGRAGVTGRLISIMLGLKPPALKGVVAEHLQCAGHLAKFVPAVGAPDLDIGVAIGQPAHRSGQPTQGV